MKTQKKLEKEARDLIEKCLNKSPQKSNLIDSDLSTILASVEEDFKKEKERVKGMNDTELASWLIDKHDSMVETMKILLKSDFLNDRDSFGRYYTLVYMNELFCLLGAYEIDWFSDNVSRILKKKGCAELISILNVLNYLNVET